MRIELPSTLATLVRGGKAVAQLTVFVNGQYMPPELGYCYAVNGDEVAIKFEGLGETMAKLAELAKTSPQLASLTGMSMIQVSIVQQGYGQWHWKDDVWTLYAEGNVKEVHRLVEGVWQTT